MPNMIVTWANVAHDIWEIEDQIIQYRGHGYIEAIVGISRGGMIPAIMLAELFGVSSDNVGMIRAVTYGPDNKQLPTNETRFHIDDWTNSLLQKTRTLIVDDIMDTRRTFDVIEKVAPLPLKCALKIKTNNHITSPPFFYGGKVHSDTWCVFPWEKR